MSISERDSGNFAHLASDNVKVDCETCREALSARLDGEAEPAPAEQTDEHLRACAACRRWRSAATEVSRTLRVREAPRAPDLTDAILANAPIPVDTRSAWPRLALGGVAVAQIGLALAQVFGGGDTAQHAEQGAVEVAGHLFNESTAWNLALGIGLLWAAFRTRAATGMIPVLAGFVVVLVAYSAHDLIAGVASVSREAGHGLLVVALALLIVIHRWYRDPAPHDADAVGHGMSGSAKDAAELPPAASSQGRRRPPLRPASRHRAA